MPSLKKKTKRKTLRSKRSRKKPARSGSLKKKTKRRTVHTAQRSNDLKYIEYPEYNNNVLINKDFRKKVIYGAVMKSMNLSGSKMQGAKFVDCVFDNTNFDNVHIDPATEFINCSFKNSKTDHIKYVDGAVKEKFETVFH